MTSESITLAQTTFGRFRMWNRSSRAVYKVIFRAREGSPARLLAVLCVVMISTAVLAQSSADKTLDRFKSMVGTWQGKSPSGKTYEVTYSLAAGGTAVMAEMHMTDEDMMSMYYVDHDQLLMTHFCPTNNQPRMKAVISSDLNNVTFDFLDATNLAGPQTGHMHRAVFLFSADPEHYAEEWTWKQEGKDTKMYFEMHRKK